MCNLPNHIYSGAYAEGHVQGIAVDRERGFIYFAFTTMLLKTDLKGRALASVKGLAGHLGCITFDAEKNRIYGSLELKHDRIGAGIISRIGYDATPEDAFYLVCFDCKKMVKPDMDAEQDGVMRAVYLRDVCRDYSGTDAVSGKPYAYGCSGIDGTALGPVFGGDKSSAKKVMIAYGIYSDNERSDNDNQVILCYDPSVFDTYALPLTQSAPHHSGPDAPEARYYFYTGNTSYGIQNLEYDAFSGHWFVAVYAGKKEQFDNFRLFYIDGSVPAAERELVGRGGEKGLVLTSAALGLQGRQPEIFGSRFAYGETGLASLGDGSFYVSHRGQIDRSHFSDVFKYTLCAENEQVLVRVIPPDGAMKGRKK